MQSATCVTGTSSGTERTGTPQGARLPPPVQHTDPLPCAASSFPSRSERIHSSSCPLAKHPSNIDMMLRTSPPVPRPESLTRRIPAAWYSVLRLWPYRPTILIPLQATKMKSRPTSLESHLKRSWNAFARHGGLRV